jgi:hypothetical protein
VAVVDPHGLAEQEGAVVGDGHAVEVGQHIAAREDGGGGGEGVGLGDEHARGRLGQAEGGLHALVLEVLPRHAELAEAWGFGKWEGRGVVVWGC